MEFLGGNDPTLPSSHESLVVSQARIARETQELARARASAEAGHVVDSPRVKAWIDSIGNAGELPVPYAGR